MSVTMKPLPVAPRYLRRNAERAMSGFLVRGVVELLTNARDSAFRMIERGDLTPAEAGARPIEVLYAKQGDSSLLRVTDRFEGMTEETVRARLLMYGEQSSEFELKGVRGINARGAKDVGSLGEVHFRTIRDGKLTECTISAGRYSEPESSEATFSARSELGLSTPNGTVVDLRPFPGISVSRFQTFVRDLERHVELRFIPEGLPRIPIIVREERPSGSGREVYLVPFSPNGELVCEEEIRLPEWHRYSDEPAIIRLYRSPSRLALGGASLTRLWRAEAGVMVVDGRTAHDVTFLRSRHAKDPVAGHVFGTLTVPHIPGLLMEYDEHERMRDNTPEATANPLNPSQVTDPDRFGLNREHPLVQALEERATPVIDRVLSQIIDEMASSSQDRVGAELKEALSKLGEKLAEKLDLSAGGAKKGKDLPLGLSCVPAGARIEIDARRRIAIYFRVPERLDPDILEASVRSQSESVGVSNSKVSLARTERDPNTYLGYVELTGISLTELCIVEVSQDDRTSFVRISVREPIDKTIVLDRDLQFSRRSYTSVPGRRKVIEMWADPSFDGEEANVFVQGTEKIRSETSSVQLAYDDELGVAAARLRVWADTPASGTIRVVAKGQHDEAMITFRLLSGNARVELRFVDREDFGKGRRFNWEDSGQDTFLSIAASHSSLARVLGPDAESWPGQDQPQTKAILAELIADAYVARKLQDELPTMGIGPENFVDPVDYENYRYRTFEECLILCHEALTPAF